MSKLITNLLDLAKVEQESKKIFDEIDLSKLIEKAILPFESLAYERKIKLDYEIKEKINYRCNGEEISELLNILLDNAIKHCEKNGKINIKLKEEKNNIILEVMNEGYPIPKEEEEKIFERFYRIDKARNGKEIRDGLSLLLISVATRRRG